MDLEKLVAKGIYRKSILVKFRTTKKHFLEYIRWRNNRSTEKLKVPEEKQITIKRLDTIRDVFLFACYTGFAYVDVATLTDAHLKIGVDGKKWLIKPRQKTGISERVPLLLYLRSYPKSYTNLPR